MRGYVDGNVREAFLTLTVVGRLGTRVQIEATVDTGFTGSLGLSREMVERLSLPLVGRGIAVLADGRSVETSYHRGRIVWHGRERGVQVLVTEGGPLVGMSLLQGSTLTLVASPGGSVIVEETT